MTDKTVTAEREALLPCPICGSSARVARYGNLDGTWWQASCLADTCRTLGPFRDTEADAATAWNTRANQHSQPACDRAERMEKALQEIKLRLHFTGWPAEPMWDAGEDGRPRWIADWRYEIDMLENALNGSERRYPERPHSVPRNQLPATPHPAGMDEAVERAREAYCDAAKVEDGVFTDPVAMRAALAAAGLPALVAECERLRAALIRIGQEAGGMLMPQVSSEFLCLVPDQVAAHIKSLADRDAAAVDECDGLRAEVARLDLVVADYANKSSHDAAACFAAETRAEQAESEVAALREGNRLHDAIVLPATVANERELIDRAEQAEARAVESAFLHIGQRVEWQTSLGNWLPGTITAWHPATYDCALDDTSSANGFARGRFRAIAQGGGTI